MTVSGNGGGDCLLQITRKAQPKEWIPGRTQRGLDQAEL